MALYLCSCLIFEKLCEKLLKPLEILNIPVSLWKCDFQNDRGQWLQTGCMINPSNGSAPRHPGQANTKSSPLLRPTKEISAMARSLCCSARAEFFSQLVSLHTFALPGLVFSPFLCQRFARKNYPFSQGTMCSVQMKANTSGVNHLTCHWTKQSFWS